MRENIGCDRGSKVRIYQCERISCAEPQCQVFRGAGKIIGVRSDPLNLGAKTDGVVSFGPGCVVLPAPRICVTALVEEVRQRISEIRAADYGRSESLGAGKNRWSKVEAETKFVSEIRFRVPS